MVKTYSPKKANLKSYDLYPYLPPMHTFLQLEEMASPTSIFVPIIYTIVIYKLYLYKIITKLYIYKIIYKIVIAGHDL